MRVYIVTEHILNAQLTYRSAFSSLENAVARVKKDCSTATLRGQKGRVWFYDNLDNDGADFFFIREMEVE